MINMDISKPKNYHNINAKKCCNKYLLPSLLQLLPSLIYDLAFGRYLELHQGQGQVVASTQTGK